METSARLNRQGQIECGDCGGLCTKYHHKLGVALVCDLCDAHQVLTPDHYAALLAAFNARARAAR
jgi:hypothetical protein